jgi:FAD/FMN-containing dehydrogenase
MTALDRSATAALRTVFHGRLLTDVMGMAPCLTDWRRMWTGRAMTVVQPDTTADVAAVLRYKSPVELKLMRAVKTALDPLGLMNPGKVI